MSNNELLKNLDAARALASEIIELERKAAEKTKQLHHMFGGTVVAGKPKPPPKYIIGLPPGWENATKVQKMRKLLEINAGRPLNAREIADNINELESLSSIASMLTRLAEGGKDPDIVKVGKGKYTFQSRSNK